MPTPNNLLAKKFTLAPPHALATMADLVALFEDSSTIINTLNEEIAALQSQITNPAIPKILNYAGIGAADNTDPFATIGNVDGGEDILGTYTLPAGTLSENGMGLLVKINIQQAANANAKAMKLYLGTNNFYDLNGNKNGFINELDIYIWRISNTSFYTRSRELLYATGTQILDATISTQAQYDDTITGFDASNVIKITGTGIATNDIQKLLFTVEPI